MTRRQRAFLFHLLASLSVAALAAALIFLVWYPPPLAQVSGGLNLFALLVGIDVVVGPALTALIATPRKPQRELWRDIALIIALQVTAFTYGMYSITLARPVLLVQSFDHLQVLSAADIDDEALKRAPPQYRHLSWHGPRLIAVRRAKTVAESMQFLDRVIEGAGLAIQTDRWVDYSSESAVVMEQARPAAALLESKPELRKILEDLAVANGKTMDDLRYLPLRGRAGWCFAVIASPDARIVGYLPPTSQ